jgi:hypothetical protein
VTLAANPLISVTPGLMIWTIVCFLIALWVLKRYAFGPIQKLIDSRQQSIQQSIEAAESARDEAQKLLEEHRKLIADARGQGEAILAEARKTRESMEQRMREETEAERPAPARGHTQGDRGRDCARAPADPSRGRRPHARGGVASRRSYARRRARPGAHLRGDRGLDFSRLEESA